MAFTLICHACGQKLTLFDIDVKKRKGSVRCTRCGACAAVCPCGCITIAR